MEHVDQLLADGTPPARRDQLGEHARAANIAIVPLLLAAGADMNEARFV